MVVGYFYGGDLSVIPTEDQSPLLIDSGVIFSVEKTAGGSGLLRFLSAALRAGVFKIYCRASSFVKSRTTVSPNTVRLSHEYRKI
jgi:hypothetical protein